MSKTDVIRDFMPDSIKEIIHTQIDLDITHLTIADVLRNIDHTYPINTIEREKVAYGSMAIAILCKSELLYPLRGILLFIVGEDIPIQALSRKYAVIVVDENSITTEKKLMNVNDDISLYLAKYYKSSIEDFTTFYNKYVYNAYEDEV